MMGHEVKVHAQLALLSESEKIDLICRLKAREEQLTALVAQANERIAPLTARVAELEARLRMNSSTPPSSDEYVKPTPTSFAPYPSGCCRSPNTKFLAKGKRGRAKSQIRQPA